MKLTNKSGLPEAIINAINYYNDKYDRGDSDYTITQLIQPIQITLLKAKHEHELEEDAEDALYKLLGQVIHDILDKSASINELTETRYFSEFAGKKVSAQIDNLFLKDGVLSDYKCTSYYSFMTNQEPKEEWVIQLNAQRELLIRNGLDVKELRIVGILRDWKKSQVKTKNYPPTHGMMMPIKTLPRDYISTWIEDRVVAVESYKNNSDFMKPTCTSEERWIRKNGPERCINWCQVSKFCRQYQGEMNG